VASVKANQAKAEKTIDEAAAEAREIINRAERLATEIHEDARKEAKVQAEVIVVKAREAIDRERQGAEPGCHANAGARFEKVASVHCVSPAMCAACGGGVMDSLPRDRRVSKACMSSKTQNSGGPNSTTGTWRRIHSKHAACCLRYASVAAGVIALMG